MLSSFYKEYELSTYTILSFLSRQLEMIGHNAKLVGVGIKIKEIKELKGTHVLRPIENETF
jgi:hypothetical protein